MADVVSARVHIGIEVEHTIEITHTVIADPVVNTTVGSATPTALSATSTPAITKVHYKDYPLTAGTATIDLAALDAGDLPDVSMVGLKIQAMYFEADADNNAGGIAITPAVAEGYPIWGSADGKLTIFPGSKAAFYANDTEAEITNDTDDKILCTGTAGDYLTVCILAG